MKIKPVILAAGKSVRFGENKLLYEINNKPMYRHITDILINLYENKVVLKPLIVINNEKIKEQLKKDNIDYVENKKSELGLSWSIKTALENIKDEPEMYYMFFTADQPYLEQETIVKFIEDFKKSNKELGCIACNNVLGNPVIFKSSYKEKLLLLEGDVGGKKIINEEIQNVYVCNISHSKELFDIDTKNDIK